MFRKDLLDLYNALNGTEYTNYEDLEINTLHDTIYMKMKNDISFLFHSVISLYEHQSSFNPNMPYRQFQYCAKLYEKIMVQNDVDLYGRRLVKIPAPQCYVFYNGGGNHAEKEILRLSDAFEVPSEGYEWTVTMLNINKGYNVDLLEQCQALKEYVDFVAMVKELARTHQINEAVDLTVVHFIKNKTKLSKFLHEHRAEVADMTITECELPTSD